MGQAIPEYEVDLFSHDSVRNARAVDDTLREFSPVVRLADGTVMITRHADVLPGSRTGRPSPTSRGRGTTRSRSAPRSC